MLFLVSIAICIFAHSLSILNLLYVLVSVWHLLRLPKTTSPSTTLVFSGPPGTGKTLAARALANSLAIPAIPGVRTADGSGMEAPLGSLPAGGSGQRVAFFMCALWGETKA